MKVSLKWLGKYVNAAAYLKDPQKLADLLTNGGLEVEGVTDEAKSFAHVVIGQITEKNKHPNADSLTLCQVSTGSAIHKIVCGAKNHNAGDKVVVALPGAVLPGDFAIKISKIRGEESQGMLCSEKELGLSTESPSGNKAVPAANGIIILPASAPVGESFAKYYKKDDVIFDIKVTPNRADCLSHFGLAREVSGLTGEKFEFPLTPFNEGRESTRKLIKLTVDDPETCLRYAGRVVQNVKVGPSPDWLKRSLEAVGLRSINNVVDVTNFVMMEVGQPLHAFDLARLEGPQIVVRKAHAKEKFVTLDEQELTFDGSELLICDASKPIALAGVMGGLNSGVTESTTQVFVESAYFLPSSVRRTSRKFGIESDSSYRFSRGVDPDSVNLGLNRACQLLMEVAGGTVCTDSYDNYPRPVAKPRVELDLNFISARLGMTIEGTEAKRWLERVGCTVSGTGAKLLVNPPPYRGDLRLPEDLGEEILRLKGFGNIPETLPQISSEPTLDDNQYFLENRLGATFRALGLSQATNLSFTASSFESKFLSSPRGSAQELGLDLAVQPVKIRNPLNLDLDIMRVALAPSLARNAVHNIRHGRPQGGLFEVAPVFAAKKMDDIRGETRPFFEEFHLGAIIWGDVGESWLKAAAQVPIFFKLKALVEGFLSSWQFKSVKFEALKECPAFLHPGQSARVVVEGKPAGFVGVIHPMTADQLELKTQVAILELNLKTLFAGQPRLNRVKPLPKFPTVDRDVALLCPISLAAGEVRGELLKAVGPLAVHCEVFDLYKGDKLPPDKKSLAFRVTYQDLQKTLSDEEINTLHQGAVSKVCQKLGLVVR